MFCTANIRPLPNSIAVLDDVRIIPSFALGLAILSRVLAVSQQPSLPKALDLEENKRFMSKTHSEAPSLHGAVLGFYTMQGDVPMPATFV